LVIAISYEADEIINNVAAVNASMNNLEKEKKQISIVLIYRSNNKW